MTTEYRVSLSYPNPSLGQMVAGSQASNSMDDEASRAKIGYGSSSQVTGLHQAALVITYGFPSSSLAILTDVGSSLDF